MAEVDLNRRAGGLRPFSAQADHHALQVAEVGAGGGMASAKPVLLALNGHLDRRITSEVTSWPDLSFVELT